MNDIDEFLAEVIPQLKHEVSAIHDGDAAPRKALWSHRDPVTLFGAWLSGRGWSDLEVAFDKLAATFAGSESMDYDVLAAGVSGDLGYVVAIERSAVVGADGQPRRYALRVTTILRREDGAWKVVHRHGDPFDDSARDLVGDRAQS
jgi:ketosteroid isomerase-like protein